MSPTPSPLLHTLLIPYLIFGPAFSFTDVSSNNPLHLLTQMRVLAELQDREKTRAHGKGRREGGAAPTYTCIHPSCNHVFSREVLESWTCRQIFFQVPGGALGTKFVPSFFGLQRKAIFSLAATFLPQRRAPNLPRSSWHEVLDNPTAYWVFPIKVNNLS